MIRRGNAARYAGVQDAAVALERDRCLAGHRQDQISGALCSVSISRGSEEITDPHYLQKFATLQKFKPKNVSDRRWIRSRSERSSLSTAAFIAHQNVD